MDDHNINQKGQPTTWRTRAIAGGALALFVSLLTGYNAHRATRAEEPRPESESSDQQALDWARLHLERQKHALELRFRRREFAERQRGSFWKDKLGNPLILAIVGGFLTLMTGIVTHYLTDRDNQIAETRRAVLARETAKETLQSDLIKKFAEAPGTQKVRENLDFLIGAGLVPTYADSMKRYLEAHPEFAPQLGGIQFSGEAISNILKARTEQTLILFKAFLKGKGFEGLGADPLVFIFSKDTPPPQKYGIQPDQQNSYYVSDNNTVYIHKDISDDIAVALREYTHHALGTAVGSRFRQNEVESALADYLPSTFLDSGEFGVPMRKRDTSLRPQFFRNIDNATAYEASSNWFQRGIVWAGALWACRQRVGRGVDDLVLPAWRRAMMEAVVPDDVLAAKRLGTTLAGAVAPFGPCLGEEMARRKLPRDM